MRKQSVLLFPWLGHGHISPFLELAKKLNSSNLFKVYICSTPANLVSVKKSLRNECLLHTIQVIELHLPELPDLPSQLHSTNGLPAHLMPKLKEAFDLSSLLFLKLLEDLRPDLLIYDILQPWAPNAAVGLCIPSVVFITTSAAASMYHFVLNAPKDGVVFTYSDTIYYRDYEYVKIANNDKEKEENIVTQCVAKSSTIVLIKSFKEIESKYLDHLSLLTDKKIVPVGPLVADPYCPDMKQNSVMQWLDTKATRSTVFVSFGSEYFLSSHDLEEIAYGLEASNVNFIWVLRFPKGESNKDVLPLGFLERVGNRGLAVEGWAPQSKILGHKNIGGFVSHCGWSSVLEAMKFGVPIIAMPMHLDQPINARLVVEVGVGIEVVRAGPTGLLKRENVALVINQVVTSQLGKVVKEKAKSLIKHMKRDNEINVAVDELLKLCKNVGRGGRLTLHKKTKSEGFDIGGVLYPDGSQLLYADEEEYSVENIAERFIEKIYVKKALVPPQLPPKTPIRMLNVKI